VISTYSFGAIPPLANYLFLHLTVYELTLISPWRNFGVFIFDYPTAPRSQEEQGREAENKLG
jgi:hypothetical protein